MSNLVSRRQALNRLWQLGGLAAASSCGWMGFRFLSSRLPTSPFGTVIRAGLLGEFPPRTVTPFEAVRFFLVCVEDGGLLALYHRCTHLACVIQWEESQFVCPCHGSLFAPDGSVTKGPADKPLVRFPIQIDSQQVVFVDTSASITRQQVTPEDFTYPTGDR